MDYTKVGQSRGVEPVGSTGGGSDPSSPVSISRVAASNALPMIKLAWTRTKQHYKYIGSAGVLYLLMLSAFGQLGSFSVLAALPTVILNAGFMRMFRKLHLAKSADFADLFVVFRETDLLIKLIPIVLVGVGVGAIQYFIGNQAGVLGSLLNLALSLVVIALTAFSVPLIMFKKVDFIRSIELNLRATTLNWEFLLAAGLILAGFAIICAILLVLPLFLVAFPVSLVSGYLMYALMFEGADLSSLAGE